MNFLLRHWLYVAAYLLLLLLLAASSALAPLAMGKWSVGLHLALALAMTAIIVALFMRVRYLDPLLKVVALGGLLFLLCMWLIMPVDYITRDTHATQVQSRHHDQLRE